MDIPKTPFPEIKTTPLQTDSLQNQVIDVLKKLQQTGLFRALVAEANGNKVLLDTAFGQVKGVATEKLAKGDEILARVQPGKEHPTIKVEKHHANIQTLPQKIVQQLIKLTHTTSNPATTLSTKASNPAATPLIKAPNLTATPLTKAPTTSSSIESSKFPQVIKVLTHTTSKTLLQINHKTYTIPRQPLLEQGETLLLKPSGNNKTELLRIHPESILKNALSNLLPRMTHSRNTTEITNLQKFISSLLKQKPDMRITTQSPINKQTVNQQPTQNTASHKPDSGVMQNKQTINKLAVKNISEKNLQSAAVNSQKENPVKFIKQLLTNLSQPVVNADNVKAESIQKMFVMLSLLKPTASINPEKPFSIQGNLTDLHTAIKHSPENFKLLLRQIIHSNAGEIKTSLADNLLAELSNSLKNELLQQLEQTISQLQLQKTSIRLNQELNQPIQINLNIPIQVNEQTTALKLKIKQRNSSENIEEKHWEINLAFEFSLLGLISTNILLQDTKLSAHFWAVKSTTKQLIDTHMNEFKDQLKKSGFELGLFDCFMGEPTTQDETSHPVTENLVDIKV